MSFVFDIALSFASEDQSLVEKVYHYLKAENLKVFFAPSSEAQTKLSGENQREIFYKIFGGDSNYVALFVSKDYIWREIPMEEANIAFAKHIENGKVIPIYLDNTSLPQDLLDPKNTNYFKSNNSAIIASHIAKKIKHQESQQTPESKSDEVKNTMNINNNKAIKQIFIQELNIKES